MAKFNYEEQAQALSRAIDIAIESIKKFPPKGFDDSHTDHFISTYLRFKKNILDPDKKYKNSQSLSYIKNDVLTYFQEGAGDAVHHFWKHVYAQNLGFSRENKLAKILKRKKIKNQTEYDFVIDVLIPYQQENLISKLDLDQLNQMIDTFEKR